ncbi:MAG: hypothetical protein R2708_01715 [Vicinamibacterales bacterium]
MLTRTFVLVALAGVAQVPAPLPQHPSPMSDTTRPHPRLAEQTPAGRRAPVGEGTLFLPPAARGPRLPLVLHFHGAPMARGAPGGEPAASGGPRHLPAGQRPGVYGRAFAEPGRLADVLAAAEAEARRITGHPVVFDPVVLSSFSAGYGAVRAILRHADDYARVSAVVLADSLHASYDARDAAAARTADLPVVAGDLDAFLRLAADAAAGRKAFVVTHSEVYPGTYASTTETADALLRAVELRRRAALDAGPIGMQQLSATSRGRLRVVGYAGNSAPDHMDHLYALGHALAAALRRR